MKWRRIAQFVLMRLANACREAGLAGYFFFWRLQKRIQTPEMRAADFARVREMTDSGWLDDDEQEAK